MMDKNHFIREVEVRENNFDSNYIINLKAKYPFDLDSIKRKKEERINIGAVYSKGGGGESILSKDLVFDVIIVSNNSNFKNYIISE